MFYAQNVKGKPGVVPTQPPPTLQEAAQVELSLEDRVLGEGHLEQATQHTDLIRELTQYPKSSLCSPAKAGRITFICNIQEMDLSLRVFIRFSFRKRDPFSVL